MFSFAQIVGTQQASQVSDVRFEDVEDGLGRSTEVDVVYCPERHVEILIQAHDKQSV